MWKRFSARNRACWQRYQTPARFCILHVPQPKARAVGGGVANSTKQPKRFGFSCEFFFKFLFSIPFHVINFCPDLCLFRTRVACGFCHVCTRKHPYTHSHARKYMHTRARALTHVHIHTCTCTYGCART